MYTPPNLLNDDGTASIATAFMMSNHGFRRDLGRFARALQQLRGEDSSKAAALRDEWKNYHTTLHGHHHSEDTGVFPSIAAQHESARETIEGLSADHRRIDPLLERGDAAFAELPNSAAAIVVVGELQALLEPHLATEEREVLPFLRELKTFPPPPNDEALAMYAEGFAWAMQGIAPDVLEKVYAMLPGALRARIPAARAAFEARSEHVWGPLTPGAARTPIPDPVA
jgi:hemerythrin-like domain-containing protein